MAQDHSDSKIPVGWLIVYVVAVSLIFWRLFIVDETPPAKVGDRPRTYLNLLVAGTYLTQEKLLPQEELQAVLGKAISSGNSIRSILADDYKVDNNKIETYLAAIAKKDLYLQKVLVEEFKKVTEEIKLRLSNVDTWFHYKFVLLGGVFLALIGGLEKAIVFACRRRPKTKASAESEQISEEHELQKILSSKSAHYVLGLGCVVALMVDMHIRHELDAIISLGNWVAYFAEPALSGVDFQEQNQGQFLLWENYLRAKDGAGETVLGTALHNMPHLFVLTLLIYILYIWTFQNICSRAMGQEKTAVMGTFLIVNGTLVAFGISASRLQLKIFSGFSLWALTADPLLLALILVVVNCVCWWLLHNKICIVRNPIPPSDSAPHSHSQATDENGVLPPAVVPQGATSSVRS